MRRPKSGFSLAECIIALLVAALALVTFLSVFSSGSRHAVQSRNRTVAILMAETLFDEIEAHPYGEPAPTWWTSQSDEPVEVIVNGRPQQMLFHKRIDYANGSFIGNTNGNEDLLTITISWRENVGDRQSGVVVPQDNKVLSLEVPVWRKL